VLTIIENGSNIWMIVTVDDALRVYARAEEGEWSELPLGGDPEQVDPEKSFMLEELYARESEDEEEDGGEDELEGEPDDEEELDEGEPELSEDEEPDDGDGEEPQEEPKPRRRRAAAPKGGRSTARQK
jgi:hypothetical protein